MCACYVLGMVIRCWGCSGKPDGCGSCTGEAYSLVEETHRTNHKMVGERK